MPSGAGLTKVLNTLESSDLTLHNRLNLPQHHLKKRQAIHLTLITTFGIKFNKYSGVVQQNLTLDDLYQ